MRKVLALVFTFTLAGLAAATPALARDHVPIRMSGKIVDSPTPDPACGGLRNASTGTLTGKPYGRSTWTSAGCLDVTAEPGVITVRDATFLLKNKVGSISGVYSGHTSLPSTMGRLYGTGKFTVTKGTGHYVRARGSGVFSSTGDIVAANADLDMAGTLVR